MNYDKWLVHEISRAVITKYICDPRFWAGLGKRTTPLPKDKYIGKCATYDSN